MEALARRPAPEGPPRFECPGDFSAVPFAPGPPFSPEMLQDPTKQLLLIRAPANFTPGSLDGHAVSLSGFQTLKVLQPDRSHKVYSMQTTPGESGGRARLLAPSDHQGRITCAPPFAGAVTIWERFGDPSGHPILLLPVANRLAPQVPEGLKQRFLPFGGQLKRPLPSLSSSRDAEMPPRKKKKKQQRQLHKVEYLGGDREVSFGEPTTPSDEGGPSHQQKEGCVAGSGEWPDQDTQPSSSLEISSQGEAGELCHRIKKKKKKRHKEEAVEKEYQLLDPNSVNQRAEEEPQGQGQLEPQAEGNCGTGVEGQVQRKHKKKKKHREEDAAAQMDLIRLKEEAASEPWEGSGNIVESSQDLTGEAPGGELPGHKPKKKKKKKKVEEEEQQPLGQETGPSVFLEPISVKQEQKGWDELDAASGQGVGGTGSLEGPEVLIQKHKKKKKRKGQESEAP